MQGKMSENKSYKEKRKGKKFKMDRILMLDQSYNSSRKMFLNAPNSIRAVRLTGLTGTFNSYTIFPYKLLFYILLKFPSVN